MVHVPRAEQALSLPVAPDAPVRQNKCTLLVLNNNFDALLGAFLVANGALAQGMDVTIFFSFWGVNVLRGDRPRKNSGKSKANIIQKMMKMMMPKGARRQKLSQMHMAGVGKGLLKHLMKKNNVMTIDEMLSALVEGGARFIVCTMSMEIMGFEERDLVEWENMSLGGVAAFVDEASTSSLSMVF
jgi:peroxiredoxin family protein